MKKFFLYTLITLLVVMSFGCVRRQAAQTGPENPNFTVVAEDAETKEILAYFQANTGYKPSVVLLDEETLSSKAAELGVSADDPSVLKSLTEGATCLLLKSEELIGKFTEMGFFEDNEALRTLTAAYRIENADLLGITVLQMPEGSELNLEALKTLVAWMTGMEAKYLKDNPDLLK